MDWQTEKRKVYVGGAVLGKHLGEMLSVDEFKEMHPDWRVHLVTICDPMNFQYYAETPEGFKSIYVSEYAVYPERRIEREQAYAKLQANAAATAR